MWSNPVVIGFLAGVAGVSLVNGGRVAYRAFRHRRLMRRYRRMLTGYHHRVKRADNLVCGHTQYHFPPHPRAECVNAQCADHFPCTERHMPAPQPENVQTADTVKP